MLSVNPDEGTVLVEGANMRWKHLRRTQQNPQGGRVEREAPLHISNVMLVSAESGTPQRVQIVTFQTEVNGRKIGTGVTGPITLRLSELFAARTAKEGDRLV